jgi:UDP-glucose 4-epimerase
MAGARAMAPANFPRVNSSGPVMSGMGLNGAKAIITGGLGLIGSHLARRLLDLGASIVIVDCLDGNSGANLFNIRDIQDRVQVVRSNIGDVNEMRDRVRDCDFLFNLAGQTSHMDSIDAPLEDLAKNCTAQLALLEACRQANPDVRIVFASTRQVYGRPKYLPVDESHPVRPVDVNGINKIAAESYHILYNDLCGMRSTVLRITNTYGPHMRIKDARQMFLGVWVRCLIDGRPLQVWGGDQRRDLVYVDDAAEAFILAATNPATVGKILNLGGSDAVRLRDLADMMVAKGGGSVEQTAFPEERKLIDIGDYVTDDSAFRSLSGWRPMVGIEEGIDRTVAFYRSHARHYI